MKIRFFNTYEPVNSFYRDLLPHLAQNSIAVEVVVSSAEYRAGRGRLTEALNHPNIQTTHIPAGIRQANSRVKKAWVMLAYMLGAAIRTLFGPGADLNFFLTQPPLFSIWGYALKIFRRQPYCCLVMDLYPDVAIQGGMLGGASWLARLLTRLSRFAWRQADFIIVIGRCMQDYLIRAGVSPDRIHIIPNWADEKNIHPVPKNKNALREQLGLADAFIVLYSGNIGQSHFFDDILNVAQRLQEIPNLYFVFIGDGIRRQEIEAAIAKHTLKNILLLPFQPLEGLAHSLSMGDVQFISLRAGFEGLLVPSKAYGALAAGCPIVYQGNSTGEIARLVIEENIGAVVPLNNPDTLEKTILRYYQNPPLVAKQGKKARRLIETNLSRMQALSKYCRLLLHCDSVKQTNGQENLCNTTSNPSS